jgi:hypothetical protein
MQVDEVDKAVWLQAMGPVYDIYRTEIGPQTLDEIQKEIAKTPEEQSTNNIGANDTSAAPAQ